MTRLTAFTVSVLSPTCLGPGARPWATAHRKDLETTRNYDEVGAPGRSRTCDPRIRSPMLYPTELQARQLIAIHREQLRTPASNAPPRSSARTAPRAVVVHFARAPVSRLSAPTRRRRVKDLSAYRGRTLSSAVLSAASGRRMGWRVCSLRSLNSTR